MSLRHLFFAILLGGVLANAQALLAQSDVAPPKAREKVVAEATRIAGERNVVPALPTPLPNPFVGRFTAEPETEAPAPTASAAPVLSGADLLARIATRIPATGTVSIGGEPLLLLGQKRLKVGDLLTISFEGQTYEVSIAAVTSTSFTVKRGEHVYTRPIRISAASANTPTRP